MLALCLLRESQNLALEVILVLRSFAFFWVGLSCDGAPTSQQGFLQSNNQLSGQNWLHSTVSSFSGNSPQQQYNFEHVFGLSEEPFYISTFSSSVDHSENHFHCIAIRGTSSLTMRPSPHVTTAGREPCSSSLSADPQ